MIVKYLILIFEEEMNNVMLGPISCSVILAEKMNLNWKLKSAKGFVTFIIRYLIAKF